MKVTATTAYSPQLYMRLRTLLTASLSKTRSEVTGQTPPLASVAAITDLWRHSNGSGFFFFYVRYMLSVVISREQIWR